MQSFKEYLIEFFNDGKQIPLLRRKGINGSKVFCPKCGKTFVYYKQKTQCRHCKSNIVSTMQTNNKLDNELN